MAERYDEDEQEDYDDDFEDDDDEEGTAIEPEEAEPWDLLSQALGSLDELESDEDLALDVTERADGAAEPERFSKVPLDQAANLIAVRQLAIGIKDGSISIDVYRSRLRLMVRSLEEGLKVVKSEAVVKYVEELPEEQKVFFVQTSKLVQALVSGGQHMMRYPETKDIADVDQGLAIIEQAFQELDDMQTKAIDMGREMVLRESALDDPRQSS